MKLDYIQIMNAPAPQGSVDTQTMDGLWTRWDVCTHLLAKFTKAAKIHTGVKTCYLERGHKESMAKRAAHYRKAVPRALSQLRTMEHYNFSLRVRAWVLGSRARRMKLRALFGEKRLANWKIRVERRLAQLADIKSGLDNYLPCRSSRRRSGSIARVDKWTPFCNGVSGEDEGWNAQEDDSKPVRKQSVRAWYILPRLPLLPRVKTDKIYQERAQFVPNISRAMPPIKFYPHELVEDYIADDEGIYVAECEANFEAKNTPVPGLRNGAYQRGAQSRETQLTRRASTKRKWTPARRPGTSAVENKPP